MSEDLGDDRGRLKASAVVISGYSDSLKHRINEITFSTPLRRELDFIKRQSGNANGVCTYAGGYTHYVWE